MKPVYDATARPGTFCAAIFDGDGVLFDSERLMFRAFIESVAEYYGRTVVYNDVLEFAGVTDREIVPVLNKRYGGAVDHAAFHAAKHERYEAIVAAEGLALIPGAAELLAACRARGWPVALASSAPHVKIARNRTATRLAFEFDAIVSGEEVARSKPAPDIFLEAARRLGVPPGDCFVVEDSIAGLRGARAAGCHAIGIATTFPAASLAAEADQVIASLEELRGELCAVG